MAYKLEENNALVQLKTAIRSKMPERMYIFHGEETFLLHHYLGQLKKLLVDDLTESFNYHKLNSETFSVQAFCDAVENLPMMAEYTFVHVDDIDLFRMPESDREKFASVIADIPDYCTVVITYETVSWNPDKRMAKFWKAISENASIVEFTKQEQRDLVAWIGRHFAAAGKQISTQLAVYLIEITGGTMTALAGEIKKICAYSEADNIVKADIDAVVEPVLDAQVFRMTDMLSRGDYAQALETLQKLVKMQEDPLAILGVIAKHMRNISYARTLMDNGKNKFDLMKACGIKEYPAQKAFDAARRFSAAFCAKATELLMETDYAMKSSLDDKQRLLELVILRLAQEARND